VSESKPLPLPQIGHVAPHPAPVTPPVDENAPPPATLREKIIAGLRKIFDPEIPVNIYDLGLIYKIDINEAARIVNVEMTLTSPNCPVADSLPGQVRSAIERIPEVTSAEVNLVWDPPWDRNMMSDDAKLILGID